MGNCTAENIQEYENVEFTEGETYEGEMENGFTEGWVYKLERMGINISVGGIMGFSIELVEIYLLIKQNMKEHFQKGRNMVKEKSHF